MNEKIELYKEVLELEPDSRIFFPLAKLLVAAHRADEALIVLEQGLERHEEFLEARLFHIDILYRLGRQQACHLQLGKLGKMFAKYAGFWHAWAAYLQASGKDPDMAAVLHFLALAFTAGPVPLHEILNRGIAASMSGAMSAFSPTSGKAADGGLARPAAGRKQASQQSAPSLSASASPAGGVQADAAAMTSAGLLQEAAPLPDRNADDMEAAEALPRISLPAFGKASDGSTVLLQDGGTSLCTRSMAEVLAEQGDIQGALDIYQALAESAVDPAERADLRQHVAMLHARLGNAAPMEQEPDKLLCSPDSKEKLVSMLERLAARVEERIYN